MAFVLADPHPGEFVDSVLMRAAHLNGFRSWPALAKSYAGKQQPIAGRGFRAPSAVRAMSALYGWSEARIARQHTLIPYQQAFACQYHRLRKTVQVDFELNRQGVRRSAPHPRVCPSCVLEDQQSLGYTFLRRHHHVVGITICTKHDVSLRELPADTTSALLSDLSAMRRARELQPTRLPELGLRFHVVVERILDWLRPSHIEQVQPTLVALARAKNYTIKPSLEPTSRSLGRRTIERKDPDAVWALDLMRLVGTRRSREPAGKINIALHPRDPCTPAIIVATLLLTDSADEALVVLSGKAKCPDVAPSNGMRLFSDDELLRAYSDGRANTKRIAQITGLHRTSVITRLRRLGLLRAEYMNPEKVRALELVAGGTALPDAAKAENVDLDWLERAVCIAVRGQLKILKKALHSRESALRGSRPLPS
jgi:hypothetical protein